MKSYEENFINYRLNNDLVSNLPFQNYYGTTFDFSTNIKNPIKSHKLSAFNKKLPSKILDQQIGTNQNNSYQLNELLELLNGINACSKCSIQNKMIYFFFINIFHFINQMINKYFYKTIHHLITNHQYKLAENYIEYKLLNPHYISKICNDLSGLLIRNEFEGAKKYLEKNSFLITGNKPQKLMRLFSNKINKLINEKKFNETHLMNQNLPEHINNSFFKKENRPIDLENSPTPKKNK